MSFRFQQPEPSDKPSCLAEAQKVMLVGAPDSSKEMEALIKFKSELEQMGPAVYLWAYINSEEIEIGSHSSENTYYLSRQSLNWFGLPKAEMRNTLNQGPLDLAINLASPSNFLAHYLVATSQTQLRTAFYTTKYAYIYDFMVSESEDKPLGHGIDTFKTYLSLIQKH